MSSLPLLLGLDQRGTQTICPQSPRRSPERVVPDDISLVGYNNLPTVGDVSPSLTTVNYPGRDIGRIAGEMILALLGGRNR